MVKYKQAVKELYQANKALFAEFKKIHDLYPTDRIKLSVEFNQKGKPILAAIEEAEGRLCGHMLNGQYAKFSHRLSEQFREEIKKSYPFIDFIGVEYSQA